MRLSNIIATIAIIFIVLISGCNTGTKTTTGQYLGGTSGLSINFVSNEPPSAFNQGDSVAVTVQLKNEGESEVQAGNAEVKILGIPHATFGISDQYKPTDGALLPKSFERSEGGEQSVEIGTLTYNEDVVNFENYDLKASACYGYYTKGDIQVCITSSQIEQSGATKTCTLTTGKSSERISKGDVSSAPVQITSLTQELRGADEVVFKLTVQNKGNGKVYKIDNSCSDLDKPESLDLIDLVKIEVPEKVSCALIDSNSNSGFIRLREGKAEITCRRTVTESSSFTERFKVTLSYKYIAVATKSLRIYSTTTSSN